MGWALSRQFSAPDSLLSMVGKRACDAAMLRSVPVYRWVSMVGRRLVRLVKESNRSTLDTSTGNNTGELEAVER